MISVVQDTSVSLWSLAIPRFHQDFTTITILFVQPHKTHAVINVMISASSPRRLLIASGASLWISLVLSRSVGITSSPRQINFDQFVRQSPRLRSKINIGWRLSASQLSSLHSARRHTPLPLVIPSPTTMIHRQIGVSVVRQVLCQYNM